MIKRRHVKFGILVIGLLVLISCTNRHNTLTLPSMKSLPHDAKRIVFIGDSITYAGRYVAFIESYLKIAHPDENYEIINIGLPSETVSGLSEVGHAGGAFPRPDAKDRLQKSLNFLKPDLIFSCYGMNDGIYLPFDDDRFAAYQQGIKSLHSVVMASGAKLIHITPPDYDARKDKAYSEVLDVYSTWLLAQSYKKQWQVIDTHFPMQKRLQKELVLDANFYYSKDGIHPNREGHWVIAQTILKALGEKPSNTFEKSIKALNPNAQTNQLFDLVYKKQSILKDAYLTHIGHQRPRMKLGLPISEAIAKAQIIESALHDLVVKLRK